MDKFSGTERELIGRKDSYQETAWKSSCLVWLWKTRLGVARVAYLETVKCMLCLFQEVSIYKGHQAFPHTTYRPYSEHLWLSYRLFSKLTETS